MSTGVMIIAGMFILVGAIGVLGDYLTEKFSSKSG